MTATPTHGPKRNGMWITGAVLVAIGIVAGIAMIGWIVVTSGALLTDNSFTFPGRTTEQLDAGTEYAIYESNSGGTIAPEDVTVTGPDGRAVDVERASSAQRNVDFNTGGATYSAAVLFRTSAAGTYKVVIGGTARGDAKVAPSVDSMTGPLLGALVGVVVAGVVFVIGLVLFIAGLIRRSRAHRPAFVAGPPPGYSWGPVPPDLRPPGSFPPPVPPPPGTPGSPGPSAPPASGAPPATPAAPSDPASSWTMPGAKYQPPTDDAAAPPDPSPHDASAPSVDADRPSSDPPPPDPWQKARERGG